MVFAKNITAIFVALIALVTALPAGSVTAFSGELECANFTSFKDVRRMRMIDDTLFVASSGGVLAITDPALKGKEYRNLDGLGTNDITDVIVDASGQKWVTGFGRLIRFDDVNSEQFLFFDNDNSLFTLKCVADDGDYLWIGAANSLVLFSKVNDGGQIQDSYQLFGDLNPSPMINDIMLEHDSIWIATSNGLAVADRSNPLLLKSPASWITFGLGNHPELGSDTVMRVTRFESNLYIASSRGLFRLDVDSGTGDTVFTPVLPRRPSVVTDLKVENDTLFFYSDSGCGYFVTAGASYYSITGVSGTGITGFNTGVYRWVASGSGGIFENSTGTFRRYAFTGLPGNVVTDLAVDNTGRLFGGFQIDQGAVLVDSSWVKITQGNRVSTKIVVDSLDNIWFGTEGGGLWYYAGDSVVRYNQTNTPMIGNSDNPPFSYTYIINTDLATDGRYLYATCYRAVNNYPVVIADLNNLNDRSGWDSLGVPNGLSDHYVTSIDIYNGELAVGNETDGVYVAQVGANPFQTDISFRHLLRENSALISNNVRVVRYAADGALWVGTNFGLSRYDIGIDRFVDVILPAGISSDITALEFDGRGNLWIGTKDGVAFREAVTGDVTVFNTLNSNIAGDYINSVRIDRKTGAVYIATTSGFTRTPGVYGPPVSSVNDVVAFPNPFIVTGAGDRVNFNLDKAGTIRIFTAAGEKIREMPLASWDGRNDRGKEVASGVYLFVITDVDGNVGKGKLLLIRR